MDKPIEFMLGSMTRPILLVSLASPIAAGGFSRPLACLRILG
jgi:hypothetical protein